MLNSMQNAAWKLKLEGRRQKADCFGRNWWVLFNEWVQPKSSNIYKFS